MSLAMSGDVYRHYKGDYYVVLHTATEAEAPGRSVVVYLSLSSGQHYVRSRANFEGHVCAAHGCPRYGEPWMAVRVEDICPEDHRAERFRRAVATPQSPTHPTAAPLAADHPAPGPNTPEDGPPSATPPSLDTCIRDGFCPKHLTRLVGIPLPPEFLGGWCPPCQRTWTVYSDPSTQTLGPAPEPADPEDPHTARRWWPW